MSPDSLLSQQAIALYRRLVAEGPVQLGSEPGAVSPDDPELAELDDIGLSYRSPCFPGAVLAVRPEVACERLLGSVQHEIARRHELLGAALNDIIGLQREFARIQSGERLAGAAVEILTDREVIGRTAKELMHSARQEALELSVSMHSSGLRHIELPLEPAVAPGVRHRAVYSGTCLDSDLGRELLRLGREAGEEQRISSRWLTSLRIADDDAALVPLDADSRRRALLVRSRPLVVLLRQWFELVWDKAAPLGSRPPALRLTSLELEILQLQACGHKDAAIARKLGVSVRTVRRHTSNILAVLGVRTRFAAGAKAVRDGWLSEA
ncbi:LuxR C-terminal-related transcriptional regulator [Streptomyces sp. KR80]|uniref:LuxR C-terminal-related transcriptional regulator n=1 Tax=Streptomyces sp. KR80 TaxID=3457426 RepID=UPI003FD32DFC